jgi:hypothetical protein
MKRPSHRDIAADAARSYRDLLAEHYDDTARWREGKALQFPDDARNARSAGALRRAANFVRDLDPAHPAFGPFVQFDLEVTFWRPTLAPSEIIGFGTDDPAGRFCFDNASVEPGPREFGSLIEKSYVSMLEDWRDAIESGIDTPPHALVELFKEADVPLWEEESDDE